MQNHQLLFPFTILSTYDLMSAAYLVDICLVLEFFCIFSFVLMLYSLDAFLADVNNI